MGLQSNGCAESRRGTRIEALRLTPPEFIVLSIARHYLETFAAPGEHGWLAATSDALACFGSEQGPRAGLSVLCAVQAMRQARQSVFRFNAARCASCSAWVSDHEKLFMNTLRAVVRGHEAAAQGYAGILCEGNETEAFLRALSVLVEDCGLVR
ncbi:hypothetical protein [Sagittula salina]|uniref:Uncharacterized protein n=1 Tax=Sagittula salina TaxID=2820268 RepID=A0A940S4F2_9RHOB|nr:hypothetical protein [Sagittula salina]MBP0483815.1 hypothetical protein [Sagittula salina]